MVEDIMKEDFHNCEFRISCPGYYKGECYTENLTVLKDPWCDLFKTERDYQHIDRVEARKTYPLASKEYLQSLITQKKSKR